DHIVAVAAPGVEHDCAATGSRIEQPGRRGEASGAHLDCMSSVFHQRVGHAFSCSIISSAVALAEPTTPGTPAPGCVPAPTRCEFSSSRKSTGVKKLLVTRCSRKPGM